MEGGVLLGNGVEISLRCSDCGFLVFWYIVMSCIPPPLARIVFECET